MAKNRIVWLGLGLTALGLAVAGFFAFRPVPTPRPDQSPTSARPKLAVLIVVDQLRGDYLARWEQQFGEGGFRRLTADGAWFQNCHYPFAYTMTGPGHAAAATGCSPDKHGIVTNDWYDRAAGESVYCVASDRHQRVPGVRADADKFASRKKAGGMSPERLLAPTLADALKDETGGKGRVVSLSFKERSAVLMGGQHPDACYWFDTSAGTAVTSTYYRDDLAPWVVAFNRAAAADRWFGKDWTRLRTGLDYAKLSGPDDVPGEGTGAGQGRTFPHPMTGGEQAVGKKYYDALYNSPFGNELLLELALAAIDAESLGGRDTPDLLCVSFSSTDVVGHCWGPDSQEVLDVTVRMDDIIRRLLDHLDAKVGKGGYVLTLTADHGICPLPEVSQAQGKDAGRVSPKVLREGAAEFLQTTFGKPGEKARWVEHGGEPWVYLNQQLLKQRGLKSADIEAALAGWLAKQPGIAAAYTRSQLAGDLPKDTPFAAAVRKSFHPDRCGDVAVITKPYYLITSALTGTSHGTPHDYDTHVPLLVFGPGVQAGARADFVTPQAAAAILAQGIGVAPPKLSEAPVPDGLLQPR